jgi:hypothetical protein
VERWHVAIVGRRRFRYAERLALTIAATSGRETAFFNTVGAGGVGIVQICFAA